MPWLYIVVAAHFLNAIVFVFDKYILSHTKLKPILYAFYVGVFGLLAFVLVPWGFYLVPLNQVLISLLAGALFIYAILFFYKSVQAGEISRITPVIGGAIPIFTLILTYLILPTRLTTDQLSAFALLVIGGVIIVWPRKKKNNQEAIIVSLASRMPVALLSSFLFAGSFVLTKYIFNLQPFVNAFLWTRIGGFIAALSLLPWVGLIVFSRQGIPQWRTLGLAGISKFFSVSAFLLLNYAIFLGNVTLVNAMQGVQYFFLLLIAIFLSHKFPKVLKEQVTREIILQKIIAIIFIILGISILALG